MDDLYERLRRVCCLRFEADTDRCDGWRGVGVGAVVVTEPAPGVLVFTESGRWKPSESYETRFRNVYRWTRLPDRWVRLEHLRFGPDRPVVLFDLEPDPDAGGRWRSTCPHLCQRDGYTATLTLSGAALEVVWSVDGPRKSSRIAYRYTER